MPHLGSNNREKLVLPYGTDHPPTGFAVSLILIGLGLLLPGIWGFAWKQEWWLACLTIAVYQLPPVVMLLKISLSAYRSILHADHGKCRAWGAAAGPPALASSIVMATLMVIYRRFDPTSMMVCLSCLGALFLLWLWLTIWMSVLTWSHFFGVSRRQGALLGAEVAVISLPVLLLHFVFGVAG